MSHRALTLLPVLALLAACGVPPEGTTEQNRADYDAAVASVGCEMISESDYLPVELQTGLTRQQVLDITAYKLRTEQAVRVQGGGVRLVTGPCAPAA